MTEIGIQSQDQLLGGIYKQFFEIEHGDGTNKQLYDRMDTKYQINNCSTKKITALEKKNPENSLKVIL